MMADTRKLRALMVEHDLTQADVAKILGISEKTMHNRMKTGIFKTNEVEILMNTLGIKDPMPIFFI